MKLPAPLVDEKVGPKGRDAAVIFPDCLILTYWDLWCLLTAQQKFESDLGRLRAYLVERRIENQFYSSYRIQEAEDLIHLAKDLAVRLMDLATVDEVLALLPERIKKKELQKGIRNLTQFNASHAPSEAMLQSPGRLLKQEAYRGQWLKLPVDPTPTAERLCSLFIPKPKIGYFPKGVTHALGRRIEKQVARELKQDCPSSSPSALSYAVHRAALTLYHEQNSWEDSYGNMGEMGQEWVNVILRETPASISADPEIFLKDLLMFLVWDIYGLCDSEQVARYINERLSTSEGEISRRILWDLSERARAAFQNYRAEEAERILKALGSVMPSSSLVSNKPARHLQLVPTLHE